jgi:hypothetical protein
VSLDGCRGAAWGVGHGTATRKVARARPLSSALALLPSRYRSSPQLPSPYSQLGVVVELAGLCCQLVSFAAFLWMTAHLHR